MTVTVYAFAEFSGSRNMGGYAFIITHTLDTIRVCGIIKEVDSLKEAHIIALHKALSHLQTIDMAGIDRLLIQVDATVPPSIWAPEKSVPAAAVRMLLMEIRKRLSYEFRDRVHHWTRKNAREIMVTTNHFKP